MEIGSEFWEYEGKLEKNNSDFWNLGVDTKFVFSGRTAIYTALEDALSKKHISNKKPLAYLPNYLCDSMIKPFIDLKFSIEFYKVDIDENGICYDIDTNKKCDVFFAMNYFGYISTNMEMYIKEFKNCGTIVIEDATHSIFSKKRYSNFSDYVVASIRKWIPVYTGALVSNLNERFIEKNLKTKSILEKKEAMRLKNHFIKNEVGNKDEFLAKFKEYNNSLEHDYIDYMIDDESYKIMMGIDIQEVIETRCQNANTIYRILKDKNIKIMFNEISEGDCPLFVPVLLDHEKRNNIRNELISRGIYLPVHWPIAYNENLNSIYKRELSLVCDQRYSRENIKEYLKVLVELL